MKKILRSFLLAWIIVPMLYGCGVPAGESEKFPEEAISRLTEEVAPVPSPQTPTPSPEPTALPDSPVYLIEYGENMPCYGELNACFEELYAQFLRSKEVFYDNAEAAGDFLFVIPYEDLYARVPDSEELKQHISGQRTDQYPDAKAAGY